MAILKRAHLRLPWLTHDRYFTTSGAGLRTVQEDSRPKSWSRAVLLGAAAIAVLGAWLLRPTPTAQAQSCCLGSPPICDNGSYCDSSTGEWACGPGSPIIVDLVGRGFELTDPPNGVLFDLRVRGKRDLISWTRIGSGNAWLALDRNGNGTIDDASELFGDATPQPLPPKGQGRNGFLALAVFDRPENGGNGDGVIDARDAVFSRLRLWHDRNHNGLSESNELLTLTSVNIRGFKLQYEDSRRKDEFGNAFRYRAEVLLDDDAQAGRWAWDVFLKVLSQ